MTFKSFNAQNGNAIQAQYIHEIGQFGAFAYSFYMEEANRSFLDVIDSPSKEEYAALAASADGVVSAFSFYEPQQKQNPYCSQSPAKKKACFFETNIFVRMTKNNLTTDGTSTRMFMVMRTKIAKGVGTCIPNWRLISCMSPSTC